MDVIGRLVMNKTAPKTVDIVRELIKAELRCSTNFMSALFAALSSDLFGVFFASFAAR